MYDPDELIQEFKTYTPLEKAALEYGETDSSLIAEQLGLIEGSLLRLREPPYRRHDHASK